METDCLYLAFSDEDLEKFILPEIRDELNRLPSKDCTESFTTNGKDNFSPAPAATHTRSTTRENQVILNKKTDVR